MKNILFIGMVIGLLLNKADAQTPEGKLSTDTTVFSNQGRSIQVLHRKYVHEYITDTVCRQEISFPQISGGIDGSIQHKVNQRFSQWFVFENCKEDDSPEVLERPEITHVLYFLLHVDAIANNLMAYSERVGSCINEDKGCKENKKLHILDLRTGEDIDPAIFKSDKASIQQVLSLVNQQLPTNAALHADELPNLQIGFDASGLVFWLEEGAARNLEGYSGKLSYAALKDLITKDSPIRSLVDGVKAF